MRGHTFSIAGWILMFLSACGSTATVDRGGISALSGAIINMGPGVDSAEASRAASIAFQHTDDLALAYEITDPPLVHNTKVNMGLKPRGLCWHWAEDMEKRLLAEDFDTLRVHRAIANVGDPFRIDHSTAIITARGDDMSDGIVLDPWRHGGTLFWAPLREDVRYDWVPRSQVLANKYRVSRVVPAQQQ
jgi:hypothetical protein